MSSAVLLAVMVVLVAVGQAAASPLFTAADAAPAFGVVFLALLTVYRGTRVGMVMTPLLAIAEAWLRGLEPGILLLAYAPVVPLAASVTGTAWPLLGPGLRLTGAVVAAGAWARLLGAAIVVLGGASTDVSTFVFALIVPGALVDALLTLAVYLPLRAGIGEPGRRSWLSWR